MVLVFYILTYVAGTPYHDKYKFEGMTKETVTRLMDNNHIPYKFVTKDQFDKAKQPERLNVGPKK